MDAGLPLRRTPGLSFGSATSEPPAEMGARRSLTQFVDDAAKRISRSEASEAYAAAVGGALIIDIRSRDARGCHGIVPGSLHIPRTVLEWRIALDSPWRSPHVGGLDQELILLCDHGYSSILAARSLVELGFHSAGDVIGGFEAWRAQGLPVRAPHRLPAAGELPGMGPPD